MITCIKCGSTCDDAKNEKRFARRHPKKCQGHARFMGGLAAGTASVDLDENECTCDRPELRCPIHDTQFTEDEL